MMSDEDLIFGDAKKAKLKDEALDTKSWLSDSELIKILKENNNED